MKYVGLAIFVLGLILHHDTVSAQLNKQQPKKLQNVGINEQLGDTIPTGLVFANSRGDSVSLKELMADSEKPVLLNPVYYECPMLCKMVIEAVFEGIQQLDWSPGDEYTIITFSIDPGETHTLAAETRQSVMDKIQNKDISKGWYFLTGKEPVIKKLTEAVGFNYRELKVKDQYAHAAAIMFLSPQGKISRYLYGLNFKQFDIKNALYEAADGKVGSTAEQLLLYCYQYNPDTGSYVAVAWRIMKLGGLATLLFLGIFLGLLWIKSLKDKNTIKTNGSA